MSIILGDDEHSRVISFINCAYPYISIYHNKNDIDNLLTWRRFRSKVLSLYGIPFNEYTKQCKKYKEL